MNLSQAFESWSSLWLPPVKLPLSDWAEANMYLSPEYSARSGNVSLYGWQRGIQACVATIGRALIWRLSKMVTATWLA